MEADREHYWMDQVITPVSTDQSYDKKKTTTHFFQLYWDITETQHIQVEGLECNSLIISIEKWLPQ